MAQSRIDPSRAKAERDYALILHKKSRKKIPEFESMEELSLVPYLDVMMNLVIFMLVTIASFMPLGILTIYPPSIRKDDAGTAEKPPESINLSVAISQDAGYLILSNDGPAPPIPRKANGEWDYEALGKRAVEIKNKHKEERTVTLSADRPIRYEVIIKTMDALRADKAKLLFDDVKFTAAQ